MFALLTQPQCLPFAVALIIMLCIALLEGVTTILGLGLSQALESVMPDFDTPGDIELDGDAGGSMALSKLLGWLRFGKVPILILLIVFLTAFGIAGLGIQSLINNLTGSMLPTMAAAVLAIIASLPLVRIGGGLIAKAIPQDESDAISENQFIGRIAVIIAGNATLGNPAQAKLRGPKGNTHYLLVEPDEKEIVFGQGDKVLIVKPNGASFYAIQNPNTALTD